jgi:hypothetical protein
MDPQTDFKAIKLDYPFLNLMTRLRPINGATRNLLTVAFEHGGYVAGGFGTVMARCYTGIIQKEDDIWNAIRSHLGQPSDREGMFANAGCGDIDVWFPDAKSHMAFCRDPRRLDNVMLKETVTGNAEEHLIVGDARVQVVRSYLAPMREQIANFDIYNGSVAFNNDWMVIPEHFETLERSHTLHVSTWASPWTMNRFFKWINRKRWYQHTTPSTGQHVYEQVIKLLEWKKKWNGTDVMNDERVRETIKANKLKKRILAQDAFRMQRMLQTVVSGLTGEQLLEVSAFFPEPLKYDFAMQEIHRRMPPT